MIRAAVLGKPISHSLSPEVHGAIYQALGLEYEYERIEADEERARALIPRKLADLSRPFTGFSLTMPLKEVGFDLSYPIDPRAMRARAINTVTARGSFNTDITGLERVLTLEQVAADEVVILGNGATARSTILALSVLGKIRRIVVTRRDSSRDRLLPIPDEAPLIISTLADWEHLHLGERTLVISTVPSTAQNSFSPRLEGFEGTLIDFSYAPSPSTLAALVTGKVISGLPLLVSQAVDQARIFSKVDFDEQEMYRKVVQSTARTMVKRE